VSEPAGTARPRTRPAIPTGQDTVNARRLSSRARARLAPARPARYPDALRAEWTKLRTLPGTGWLLLATAALTIAVGAAAAAAVTCSPGRRGGAPAATGADPAKIALTGVYLGQVLTAALGVLVIGGEYAAGMIRVSLTATPGRLTLLAAKVTLVTGCALTASLAGVLGSLLAGSLILPGRGLTAASGYPALSLASGPALRAAAGTVLYLTLVALLALGVTTLVRDSAAGIGAVLGLLYLFPVIITVIPDHVLARHLEQIAPMNAGLDVQATTGLANLPLTPWQGLAVTAAWAAGALLLGGAALRLRDA
jgi:ABC-2 type transport system permease protein